MAVGAGREFDRDPLSVQQDSLKSRRHGSRSYRPLLQDHRTATIGWLANHAAEPGAQSICRSFVSRCRYSLPAAQRGVGASGIGEC